MNKRKLITPAEAADRLAVIADRAEDTYASLDELLSAYQLPAFATPQTVQARRLMKRAKEHLDLASELAERKEVS